MSVSECDSYINTIDIIEDMVIDNDKFPVIKDNKIKKCCRNTLEIVKVILAFVQCNKQIARPKKT